MNKTLESLGVTFGRKHIAVNGNFYRVARPTEAFWDWYKQNKTALKDSGYSVYKHTDYGFCVYDWTDKRPATAEEKEQYAAEKSAYEKQQLHDSWCALAVDVEDRSYDELQECSTWEELRAEVDRLFDNPDYVWEEDILRNKTPDFYWS